MTSSYSTAKTAFPKRCEWIQSFQYLPWLQHSRSRQSETSSWGFHGSCSWAVDRMASASYSITGEHILSLLSLWITICCEFCHVAWSRIKLTQDVRQLWVKVHNDFWCVQQEFENILFLGLQLLVVIERILSFPVTSPVMKILTGLEVLLRKAQVRLSAHCIAVLCLTF